MEKRTRLRTYKKIEKARADRLTLPSTPGASAKLMKYEARRWQPERSAGTRFGGKDVTQLNTKIRRTDRERFDLYAEEFGLDRTGLANLLLVRELRVGRLKDHDLQRLEGGRDAKITAHLRADHRKEFVAHAREVGMSASAAAALVVLTELDERWLESALAAVY